MTAPEAGQSCCVVQKQHSQTNLQQEQATGATCTTVLLSQGMGTRTCYARGRLPLQDRCNPLSSLYQIIFITLIFR